MPLATVILLAAVITPPPVIAKLRDGTTLAIPAASPPPPQRFIIEFRDPPLARRGVTAASPTQRATIERFRRDVATLGFAKKNGVVAIDHEYFRAFHGVSAALDTSSLETVRGYSYVKMVYADAPVQAFAAHDTAHLERIGVPRMWAEHNVRGEGIVVAVIDSGVDYTHPALGGGLGPAYKVMGGYDFVASDADPMDEHGHGTHVAGILAGSSAEVRGVAPNVKLLAYRVLDRNGQGTMAVLLAAIERTVDPNGDGDLSDRADVANLSLGGGGDADSPVSRAVDAASEAGVVFCLSAGNTPGEHTVGAPGSSRLAITVGSTDANDRLALYSSRGPAGPDWTLKPEIVAPGSEILSAKLGGGTIVMSGTSMAAPHVSGAVALLLLLHPDWTSADVKSALASHAFPIEEPVMGQGGGRLDVPAAASPRAAVYPATVSFGRHAGKEAWTARRTITIANRSESPQTYVATFATPAGITLTAEPGELTLAPGASGDVVLDVAVSAEAGASSPLVSHGGRITLTSAAEVLDVPWAAIDAAVVTVTHEKDSKMYWACERGSGVFIAYLGPGFGPGLELLVPNSRCELFAITLPNSDNVGPLFLMKKTIQADDDATPAFQVADAVHEVRYAGVDQNGSPISSIGFSLATPYFNSLVVHFPPESKIHTLMIGTFNAEPVRISELDDGHTLTISELLIDFPSHEIYSIQHAPLHGMHGSTTLSSLPSDLVRGRITVAPQPPGTWLHALYTIMADGLPWVGGMNEGAALESGWTGDLYVTRDLDPLTWSAVGLHTSRAGEGQWWLLRSPSFRVVGEDLVASNQTSPYPGEYRAGAKRTVAIGELPRFLRTGVWKVGETGFGIQATGHGPAGERWASASLGLEYEVRDAAGSVQRGALADTERFEVDFGGRGAYQAVLRSESGERIDLSFDTSRPDFSPPMLLWLRVLDSHGGIVSSVRRGNSVTLEFGAVDIGLGLHTQRLSWRTPPFGFRPPGEWHELPLVRATEDAFRADLTPATLLTDRAIELRIELEDESGNTSTSILPYPLVTLGRRRAVGR